MQVEFVEAKSRREASLKCPWAVKIVVIDGGYLCYESLEDYERDRTRENVPRETSER